MIRPSASAVPRLLACPASAVLPQLDYRTTYAEDGQERHADAEMASDLGDVDALPDAVRAMILHGDVTAAEGCFAYDCATGTARELGHVKHRAYRDLAPYEIPGTIDLLIRGNGRIIVVDYKSFEEVTEAERNEQTATYALMVARAYGYDEVTVAIVYLAAPRKPSIATLGPLDLDAHAERLKQLQLDVARAAQNPAAFLKAGRWCKYCPAFLSCDLQHALKLEVANESIALRVEASIPFADDESAADAFDLLQRIKTLTARMTAALYARAKERPVPLHDGTVLGEVTEQGNRKIDGDVAYKTLRSLHGQSIADAAVERKATQKSIEAALQFVGAKGEVAALKRDALKAIEAAGGVTRETKTAIKVFDPQKQLKAASSG